MGGKRKYTGRRKKYQRKSIAKQATQAVMRYMETKRVDQEISLSPISTALGNMRINNVGAGVRDYERVGNTVQCLYAYIKASITYPDTTNKVRVLVVMDKQSNNGALPAMSDIFTFPLIPVDSFINPDFRDRYDILADRVYAGGTGGPVAKSIKLYVPMHKYRTVYGADEGTDIKTNCAWLFVVSDSAAIPHPVLDGGIRFAYKDA